MSNLTLYYAIPSRGMIVHWMLEELGQPYERKILDLDAEEHKTPEYLAINPMGKVPALIHGDVVITETAAINVYLAEAFPQAGLSVPVESPLRAAYLSWMFFAPVTAEPAILWKALGNVVTDVDYKPFADLETVASTLQSALRGREFILGDTFTAADIMIGATIMWGLRLMPVLPALPELVAYWERLEKRSAWQRANAFDMQILSERAES